MKIPSGPATMLSRLVLLTLLIVACSSEERLATVCVSDDECPANFACESGRCVCRSDASCQANETCNMAGFCQARVGCETSLDCPEGQFCDRTTGNCLDRDRCTDDLQCDLGEVCDLVRFECVPGCREVGDCPLGDVCLCPGTQLPKCDPDSQSCPEGSTCALGACVTGPCGDSSYCRYGESCLEESPGGVRRCTKDTRGPFCEQCSIPPGSTRWFCPGDQANFCLIDTSKGYGSNFCGVECGDGAGMQCPWGFECSDVLILTQDTCGKRGQAASCRVREDLDCEKDADCPGGECDPVRLKCRPSCVGGEGDVQGFCTCLEDADCPADTCSDDGRCEISRQPCDPSRTDSCRRIYCKNQIDKLSQRSVGYCFIGRNCAPTEGITCDQVRANR